MPYHSFLHLPKTWGRVWLPLLPMPIEFPGEDKLAAWHIYLGKVDILLWQWTFSCWNDTVLYHLQVLRKEEDPGKMVFKMGENMARPSVEMYLYSEIKIQLFPLLNYWCELIPLAYISPPVLTAVSILTVSSLLIFPVLRKKWPCESPCHHFFFNF